MQIDWDKINEVKEQAQNGEIVDDGLGSSVSNMGGDIDNLIGLLQNSQIDGISSVVSSLAAANGAQNIAKLASHINDTKDKMLGRLSTLNSFSSMKSALANNASSPPQSLPVVMPDNIGEGLATIEEAAAMETESTEEPEAPQEPVASPFLSDAFGAVLTARSMLSKVSGLTEKIGALSGLRTTLQSAETALAQAESAFVSGGITKAQRDAVAAQHEEAQLAVDGATDNIKSLSGELGENLEGVEETISKEDAFHENAEKELDAFATAMKLVNMANDPTAKAVLGAIGSESFLSKMR